jgi:regulator of protease activity HflC (stomatin/prohibitin superfamily)
LNNASDKWGVDCLRYEIKDIKPPEQIRRSMELQAESERIKRSKILHSEGEMRSKINIAEAIKNELLFEGQGEAAKITNEAKSLCEALNNIATAIDVGGLAGGDSQALRLRISEQYLEAV